MAGSKCESAALCENDPVLLGNLQQLLTIGANEHIFRKNEELDMKNGTMSVISVMDTHHDSLHTVIYLLNPALCMLPCLLRAAGAEGGALF